jgi:ferrous iron transport protein B
MQANKKKQILLVGNPNVGKSTVFNALCNKKQKTGNYAGVTVASHSGNYTV